MTDVEKKQPLDEMAEFFWTQSIVPGITWDDCVALALGLYDAGYRKPAPTEKRVEAVKDIINEFASKPISDDDYEWFNETHDWEDCPRCGGEGFIELVDAPEMWGEDCLSEENCLIDCPECRERERDRLAIIREHRYEELARTICSLFPEPELTVLSNKELEKLAGTWQMFCDLQPLLSDVAQAQLAHNLREIRGK